MAAHGRSPAMTLALRPQPSPARVRPQPHRRVRPEPHPRVRPKLERGVRPQPYLAAKAVSARKKTNRNSSWPQNTRHRLFPSGAARADLVGRSDTKENNLVTCRRSLQIPSMILLSGRKLSLQSFRLDKLGVSNSRKGSFRLRTEKFWTHKERVSDSENP